MRFLILFRVSNRKLKRTNKKKREWNFYSKAYDVYMPIFPRGWGDIMEFQITTFALALPAYLLTIGTTHKKHVTN